MTGVPESAAEVAHRMQAWQQGHLSGVDSSVILGAVRDAVNEASESLRAVREWCDKANAGAYCSHRDADPGNTRKPGCDVCELVDFMVEEVRNLLPPIPDAAEEVEQVDGTRVTPDGDREY